MTHRVCRKRSTTTFKVNDQYCKLFLTPLYQYRPNHWVWKVGFAVSKSKRQLNDWYYERSNRRSKKLHSQLTGKAGIKTITQGFNQVLLQRWNLEPGDCLFIDCTSIEVEKQFHAFSRWLRYHPDWEVDFNGKVFWWHRPPYARDPLYELGRITPVVPADPLAPLVDEKYFQSFLFHPFPGVLEDMLQSTAQTDCQSDQAQQHYKVDNNQNEENQESQHRLPEEGDQT